MALIAFSSWSHAFLTPRTGYLHPDIEAAGQHELLNWICLAGAMHALGRRAEIVDWVETYVFNSSKCFAVFPCS